jgi:hypothetical protein
VGIDGFAIYRQIRFEDKGEITKEERWQEWWRECLPRKNWSPNILMRPEAVPIPGSMLEDSGRYVSSEQCHLQHKLQRHGDEYL